MMRDVVEWRRWRDMVVWRTWWRWVGVGWMLYVPRVVPVDVLPLSFAVLGGHLSSHDGLLFLPKPFYFLLDPDQLVLLSCGIIFIYFFVLVLDLDLIKLGVALDNLQR
jgi:hypothetical protein